MLLYNIRVAGKEGSKLESEMDGPGSPPEYPGNDAHPGSPVPLMSFVDLNSVKGLTRVHYNQVGHPQIIKGGVNPTDPVKQL